MIGRRDDEAMGGEVGGDRRALQPHTGEAVAEEHETDHPVSRIRVTRRRVGEHRVGVVAQQVADDLRREVAQVV
jgi:hypothetical protein